MTSIQQSIISRFSYDENKEKKEMAQISDLKAGVNKGKLFSLKITNLASSVDKVPCNFIFMDKTGNFGCLSVYNNTQKISDEMKNLVQIFIQNPIFKPVKLTLEKMEWSMPII
jgi:hypothetical protein